MDSMLERLRQIEADAREAVSAARTRKSLDEARVRFLGRKGELTAAMHGFGALPQEERPQMGQAANEARGAIETLLADAERTIAEAALVERLESEAVDITLPGKRRRLGHKHPITLAADEVADVFLGMGYRMAEGPEIEYDRYNFELLNIPKGHPARDTQDSFFIDDAMPCPDPGTAPSPAPGTAPGTVPGTASGAAPGAAPGSMLGDAAVVLRTHTSPAQIRTMLSQPPPIKIICPGRVYRLDEFDATHSPVFYQIEGLFVDKGVTMGDLIGTLQTFTRHVFGPDAKIRLRPHHFQFTEPSAEVDVSCWVCGGSGCRVCKGEGFVELLGAGMVNPKVLSMCGVDPGIYSGLAFGVGLERIAICKYNVDSLRTLYENDIRFLRQF